MNGTENCLTNLAKVVLTAHKTAVFLCVHSKAYPPLSLSGGGGFLFILIQRVYNIIYRHAVGISNTV